MATAHRCGPSPATTERRLEGNRRFSDVAYRPEYAPNSGVMEYDLGYFPADVERAYLRIEWFVTDDFRVHYSEQYSSGELWEFRWETSERAQDER